MSAMAESEIIYLDNNATTQLDPAVIEEMLPFLTKYYGNPSSGYGFAATARKAINLANASLRCSAVNRQKLFLLAAALNPIMP
jgi:cysteine sulfinate desulfinase/cysteine desulfurase-like protein